MSPGSREATKIRRVWYGGSPRSPPWLLVAPAAGRAAPITTICGVVKGTGRRSPKRSCNQPVGWCSSARRDVAQVGSSEQRAGCAVWHPVHQGNLARSHALPVGADAVLRRPQRRRTTRAAPARAVLLGSCQSCQSSRAGPPRGCRNRSGGHKESSSALELPVLLQPNLNTGE